MGKVLRGQTVFSLKEDPNPLAAGFSYFIRGRILVDFGRGKNVGVLPYIEQQQDWNIKLATLLSNFGDCWLAATSSQITCCPSGPCKHKTL